MIKIKRVFVEITNVCNLACSFCPGTARAKAFMELAVFQKIINEAKFIADEIVFHVLGEPLLHPQLLEFIDIVHAAGMTVMITTNGTLLTSELAKRKSDKLIFLYML